MAAAALIDWSYLPGGANMQPHVICGSLDPRECTPLHARHINRFNGFSVFIAVTNRQPG